MMFCKDFHQDKLINYATLRQCFHFWTAREPHAAWSVIGSSATAVEVHCEFKNNLGGKYSLIMYNYQNVVLSCLPYYQSIIIILTESLIYFLDYNCLCGDFG